MGNKPPIRVRARATVNGVSFAPVEASGPLWADATSRDEWPVR